MTWIKVCGVDDIVQEDLVRLDHSGKTYVLYRSPVDQYYATDGLCMHEKVHFEDGLVMGNIIECLKHNGRFNYKTGEVKSAPVCVNLKTYPTKLEAAVIYIEVMS
jgi:3-phenylpropionate/trans-cinnamate dioxygenase ferredoxin component